MNIIYRYNRPSGLHTASISVADETFNASIGILVPDLDYTGNYDPPLIPSKQVDLSFELEEFKSLPEISDGAMMTFDVTGLVYGKPIAWRNIYAGTVVGRRSTLDFLRESAWNTCIRILVPSRKIDSFRQCKYIVQMLDESSVLACKEKVAVFKLPAQFNAMQYNPALSGPSEKSLASEYASYAIQLKDFEGRDVHLPADIFLETTAGTLSRPRVSLDAYGRGDFDLFTKGIRQGEVVKLKAGFRYYPGASEALTTFTE